MKAMNSVERSSAQWFEEAKQCYVDGHQACAWCRGPHQVHKVDTDDGVEFHCNRCDFHVGYDARRDRYVLIPGDKKVIKAAPLTMHDIKVSQ
jgi:hypothetical protein